jgi:hypothetical protein
MIWLKLRKAKKTKSAKIQHGTGASRWSLNHMPTMGYSTFAMFAVGEEVILTKMPARAADAAAV